jgi:uncharacterized protein YbjT (DUF2867 family)
VSRANEVNSQGTVRVVLIGATGFIGSAVSAALLGRGHWVLALYHHGAEPAPGPRLRWIKCDIARMTSPDWAPILRGAEAVINCAGVLQDNAWETTTGTHVEGVRELVAACERAHIGRLIQFSAIGADHHATTAFSQTKLAGEKIVQASFLDWVILRPSVVVGRGAFGGSALFRGLASASFLPVMKNTAPLQIVQREDVVATVLYFIENPEKGRIALDLAGPEKLSFVEVVAAYRGWLGWPTAKLFHLPVFASQILYGLGDFARILGWRPPLGRTARREIAWGATGDPGPWHAATGISPMRLADALAAEPACVQERWFSRLYLLKPVGFTILSLFWIATGVTSLTFGYREGIELLRGTQGDVAARCTVIAGALADIGIGIGIALRPVTRAALRASLGLTGLYVAIGTVMVPGLWTQPLGPLLKTAPIVAFTLFLLAILEER